MPIARSQGVKDEACQRLLGFSSWEVREHASVSHQLRSLSVPGTVPCCHGKAWRCCHMLIVLRPILICTLKSLPHKSLIVCGRTVEQLKAYKNLP